MNRKDIRHAAIGMAAGVSVFAALYALVEFDPLDDIAESGARRRLTSEERAELDRIAAEQAVLREKCHAQYEQRRQERDAEAARYAAGFCPEWLSTPGAVSSPQELALPDLVCEIEPAEKSYRCGGPNMHGWYRHREALFMDFRERRNNWEARYKVSRPDRMRLDIAAKRIDEARSRPFAVNPPPLMAPDFGDFPPYPDFTSSDAADQTASATTTEE
ncbi:hypothetical protein ACFQZZ_14920 [Nocardia sp. GCM10030253]|uniref:hypothetical protein n=1 Tax=Nocardia sp. GCM10030253 TaxID=3273404 RepID=UPI00363BB94F